MLLKRIWFILSPSSVYLFCACYPQLNQESEYHWIDLVAGLSRPGDCSLLSVKPRVHIAPEKSGQSAPTLYSCRLYITVCWIYKVIMSPLYRGGNILVYLWPLSLSVCLWVSHSFCPAISMVLAVKHSTLTQCWSIVGPPSTTLTQY